MNVIAQTSRKSIIKVIIVFIAAVVLSCIIFGTSGCGDGNPLDGVPGVNFGTEEDVYESGRRIMESLEVRLALAKYRSPGVYVELADHYYVHYTYEEVTAYIEENDVDSYTYIRQFRDCDDFATILIGDLKREFPGIAAGYMRVRLNGYLHAIVGFYAPEHSPKVIFFEPQNDAVLEYGDNWYISRVYFREFNR